MPAQYGSDLPHLWIAGDDEMGLSGTFRLDLHALCERYLIVVLSNAMIRGVESDCQNTQGVVDVLEILSSE
jgi:hypothetical protein